MKLTPKIVVCMALALTAVARGRQLVYPETVALPEAESVAPPGVKLTEEDRKVLRLLADDLEAQRKFDPVSASNHGDRRFDALLPDVSPEGLQQRLNDTFRRQQQSYGLDQGLMSSYGKLNFRLLEFELAARLERSRFNLQQMAVLPVSGPQIELPQLPDQLTFSNDKQLEDYIKRMEAIPTYLEQVMNNMLGGAAEGRTPPKMIMGSVADQAAVNGGQRFIDDPTAHVMYRPFAGMSGPLAERAQKAIKEKVAPAFEKFAEFLRGQYVPRCRSTLGASELPEGPSYYDAMARFHTTLLLNPEDIHQKGLEEVKRIRAEMMEVIARSDFAQKDSLKGEELFKAFVTYLRTDKRFYYTNSDDLLNGYRAIAKRIDAEMPSLFGRLPRLAYGVREMPRYIAPSSPTAFYYHGSIENGVPGYFVANTYRLDSRPKYEMIPLTLHEAVPGHHHQIALAQELKAQGLPEWRQTADYTAFVEGWGLYAESLGLEMEASAENPKGLFADPYDDFGRLSYEMWRAMRLVVDTGIHRMGWPREKAVQYMLDNSALTEENINREVDRYISWPGQALAYKMGELYIKDLRKRAKDELGAKFDVRAFHDTVLKNGAVPLDVLDEVVSEWIASVKAAG